jgi:hypothetical protein
MLKEARDKRTLAVETDAADTASMSSAELTTAVPTPVGKEGFTGFSVWELELEVVLLLSLPLSLLSSSLDDDDLTLPLPTATDKGADTTFNNKPSSGSFGTEATIGASFETTTGPCTATVTTGAEGTPPSTVSFNVSATGTAD